MKVLHVITNLGQGGAENALYRLVLASQSRVEHIVVSMMGDAYFGPRLREAGATVHTLDKPRGRLTVVGIARLRRLIVDTRPDVVQTWMYHADLVGGVVARWAGVRAVVWGIRHSNLDSAHSSLSARVVAKVCSMLSTSVPAAIVCCSERAAKVHQDLGYAAEKFEVIPNGYDLDSLTPDPAGRQRLRSQWGIRADQRLIGMVARWDPQKDHRCLLSAIAALRRDSVRVKCVLVGSGMECANEMLVRQIEEFGLANDVILAGSRDDIRAVMTALDVHVLSSAYGEAFPNVVAEAMACGTPCVVTDVGDASIIVGETGWVVPPQDEGRLSHAIHEALDAKFSAESEVTSQRCRARIRSHFSIENMVTQYCALWKRIADTSIRE